MLSLITPPTLRIWLLCALSFFVTSLSNAENPVENPYSKENLNFESTGQNDVDLHKAWEWMKKNGKVARDWMNDHAILGNGVVGVGYQTQLPTNHAATSWAEASVETRLYSSRAERIRKKANNISDALSQALAERNAYIQKAKAEILKCQSEDRCGFAIKDIKAFKFKTTSYDNHNFYSIIQHGALDLYYESKKSTSIQLLTDSIELCERDMNLIKAAPVATLFSRHDVKHPDTFEYGYSDDGIRVLYNTTVERKDAITDDTLLLPFETNIRIPVSGGGATQIADLRAGLFRFMWDEGFNLQILSYIQKTYLNQLGTINGGEIAELSINQELSINGLPYVELVFKGTASFSVVNLGTTGQNMYNAAATAADVPGGTKFNIFKAAIDSQAGYSVGLRIAKKVLIEMSQGLEHLYTSDSSSPDTLKYSLLRTYKGAALKYTPVSWMTLITNVRSETFDQEATATSKVGGKATTTDVSSIPYGGLTLQLNW